MPDYDFQIKEFKGKPEEELQERPTPNFFNKIIATERYLKWVWIIIGVLVLAGAAAFFIGRGSFQERNLNLSVEAPEEAVSGDEIEYKIKIENNNKVSLVDVKLIVFYAEESLVFDEEGNQLVSLVEEVDLENLRSGETRELIKNPLVIGKAGDSRTARFRLNFRPEGVSTVFEKETIFKTTISKVPVSLTLVVPPNIFPDQEISVLLDYRNETDTDLNDLRIRFDYPEGLSINRLIPSPDGGSNIWDISTLEPGRGERIEIKGTVSGRQREVKNFTAVLQKRVSGRFLDFGRISAQSVISSPLLSLEIFVNNSRDYVAKPGEPLNYKIKFKNDSRSNLSGLNLTAKLEGSFFEFAALDAGGGFFDQNANTILWNASVIPQLENLRAGQEGEVNFAVGLKPDIGFQKDVSLRVSATIESPSVPPDFAGEKVTARDDLITRVSTVSDFQAAGYYSDPSWQINSGPHPPKVGQKTTYTIHWIISTSTSDLTDVKVKTFLLPGVNWENNVRVNFGESRPEYNASTGEVLWEIPQVPAGAGTTLPKYEVIFQVGVTPSVNQVNQPVLLVRPSEFSAIDSFTRNQIIINRNEITTSTLTDQPGGGSVQP